VYARKRGLNPIPPWWSADRLADFAGNCAYGCGRPATGHDHIWPVVRGGRSVPSNVVPACQPCNSSKKDGDPTPWVERGFLAFPTQWTDVLALAIEHGTDEWLEAGLDG
jgi:5-methylcytosine-specific restriction endonuclease McrA